MEEVVAKLTRREAEAIIEVADDGEPEVDVYNGSLDELGDLVVRTKEELDTLSRAFEKLDGDGIRESISELRSLARQMSTEVEQACAWTPTFLDFDHQLLGSAANKLDLARYVS